MKGIAIDDAAIVMAEADTVATALADLEAGREFDLSGYGFAVGEHAVTLTEPIEFGHKFALEPIAEGELIRKYDEVVGEATRDIATGEWVHTHNVESTRARPGDESDGADNGESAGADAPAAATEGDR